jgi:hypothetical protein
MKTWIFLFILSITVVSGCKKDEVINLPNDLPNFGNAKFSNPTVITNSYYGPALGKTYVYKGGNAGQTPIEEIAISRRPTFKTVNGISCIIHHDLVKKNGIVIEDTDDWLAQDDKGNLWYFGEYVKNFNDDGSPSNNDGSWEAGLNGALAGYWMPVNPILGQKYYQEYFKDEAEDQAEVIETNKSVTIAIGTYSNCIVTKDFTVFEPNIYEKKYYAPGIGFIKEEKFENNVLIEVLELVEIK